MPETGNVVCVEDFFATIESYLNKEQVEFVRKAYDVAAEAHASQRRKSGEPYIIHPLGVATILSQLQLDELTLAAAFLHDVVEDTDISLDSLKESFGQKVADLVDGVTKLGKIEYISKEEQQIENYRKMFLAMAKDIRVVMIKLADRLHNMRTMKFMPVHKQQSISRETMEIYAPLAHRLGIYTIKWELEDLAFRYMEPEIYYDLVEQVKVKRREREAMVHSAMGEIKEHLDSMNITCEIQGRPKNFYSIHKKMLRDHKELSEIYDLLAIRVLVDSVKDCYGTLGVVHSMWRPIPGRFKDYVAVPKSNMYQSLHTTVIGHEGIPFEVQIRTWEMDQTAEAIGRCVNLLRAFRRRIGMIFQSFNLVTRTTVIKNVLTAFVPELPWWRAALGIFTKAEKTAALEALDKVGILDKAFVRADQLSGGQQQRVALARTLAQNPQIILAGEPVASLDPVTAKQVMDDFQRINRDMRITILINIHHVDLALQYATRVIGIRAGRVVYDGPAGEVDGAVLDAIYQDRKEATA